MSTEINAVKSTDRHLILDVLRGFALFGICLANYPEFSSYLFQKKEVIELMPTAGIDRIIRYLQYIFIDGKFYSMFSLLFGVGFSIILQKKGGGYTIFYRRMSVLAIIGLMHLMLLWSGDILLLYALLGFLLPFFRNVPDKKLLMFSAVLILFPILMNTLRQITGGHFDLRAPVMDVIHYLDHKNGITDEKYSVWLVESNSYSDVLKFTLSGFFRRCRELIESNRVFKIFGLFLFGLYLGRNRIYSRLEEYKNVLKKIRNYGFLIGLPISCLYAWSELSHPLDFITSSIIFAFSVAPLSLAYASAICLWYLKNKERPVFKILAAPGKMALTNYIMQTVFGIIIFYGIGFGLGATMGLVYIEMIAIGVFLIQIIYSILWQRYFLFGPLEWVWRMLTYGKWLKLAKDPNNPAEQSSQ